MATGIFKRPVDGPWRLELCGLKNDTIVSAGPDERLDQALSIYPREHYAFWSSVLNRTDLSAGAFGENLTTCGVLEEEVRIGDIFRIGTAVVQVTQPRSPCRKLNAKFDFPISKQFMRSGRTGMYLRVLEPGECAATNAIELLERDASAPTVAQTNRLIYIDYWDAEGLAELVAVTPLSDQVRSLAQQRLDRCSKTEGWVGYRPLRIVEARSENDAYVSYSLVCEYGRALHPYLGGQVLPVMQSTDAGESAYHASACILSGDPSNSRRTYEITLRSGHLPRFVSAGAVSSYLGGSLQVGQILRAAKPTGRFFVPEEVRTAVIVSEGLGIAAGLAIMRDVAKRATPPQLVVLHGEIRPDLLPFAQILNSAVQDSGADFKVFVRARGRFEAPGWLRLSDGWPAPWHEDAYWTWCESASFFLAGSSSFVSEIETRLRADGVTAAQIVVQAYGRSDEPGPAEPF